MSSPDCSGRGFASGRFHTGNSDRDNMAQDRFNDAREPEAASSGFGQRLNSAGFEHADNYTRPFNREDLNARGNAVRNRFDRRTLYKADWLDHHPNCWRYPGMGNYCWGYTSWPVFAGFWGVPASGYPQDYDYGNNITYQYNNVYNGDQAWTASDYYNQAANLAQSAPSASAMLESPAATFGDTPKQPPMKASKHKPDWKPFGVFSLVQQGEMDSTKIFQLAANKDGTIRGNYYDTLTDEAKPVSGAVDKKTMRAAWRITGNNDVVYDTGVSNLLKPQSPILVHFNKDKTEQWELVRLKS
jgi:hypothetical protein